LRTGHSSTWRASSSSRRTRPGMSASGAFWMRSMSRAMARCTGFRRGWAARAMRWSAACSAEISGWAVPVSWACCCAKRSADSRSWTRLSSRERESVSISSSSWLRCRLTSDSRTSATASRACSSCVRASACAANRRASAACVALSWLRRASSCWVDPSFSHNRPLMISARVASTMASTAAQRPERGAAATGTAVGITGAAPPAAEGAERGVSGWVWLMGGSSSILECAARRAGSGGFPSPGQSRSRARWPRCGGA